LGGGGGENNPAGTGGDGVGGGPPHAGGRGGGDTGGSRFFFLIGVLGLGSFGSSFGRGFSGLFEPGKGTRMGGGGGGISAGGGQPGLGFRAGHAIVVGLGRLERVGTQEYHKNNPPKKGGGQKGMAKGLATDKPPTRATMSRGNPGNMLGALIGTLWEGGGGVSGGGKKGGKGVGGKQILSQRAAEFVIFGGKPFFFRATNFVWGRVVGGTAPPPP